MDLGSFSLKSHVILCQLGGDLRKNTWFLSRSLKFQDSKKYDLPTDEFHLNKGRVLLSNHVHELTKSYIYDFWSLILFNTSS